MKQMNVINFSDYFKRAVRTIIEARNIQTETEEVVSSLAHHGFVDGEFGEGSKENPDILDAVEDQVKTQLLEKYLKELSS